MKATPEQLADAALVKARAAHAAMLRARDGFRTQLAERAPDLVGAFDEVMKASDAKIDSVIEGLREINRGRD